ncbi:hypothetical protein GGR56DRAFT_517845 [Xylariaceae sp. FL0804]|nr:hypothetical protein GGR56DRAFT_517845 [Xylariaceae sp. FL0804]
MLIGKAALAGTSRTQAGLFCGLPPVAAAATPGAAAATGDAGAIGATGAAGDTAVVAAVAASGAAAGAAAGDSADVGATANTPVAATVTAAAASAATATVTATANADVDHGGAFFGSPAQCPPLSLANGLSTGYFYITTTFSIRAFLYVDPKDHKKEPVRGAEQGGRGIIDIKRQHGGGRGQRGRGG